ncbi:hypothetical protein JCM6882_002865 [Rhodosporidiobolus microsporus]
MPSTPPVSPVKAAAPDSPLHASASRFATANDVPPPRSSLDYRTSDDEPLSARADAAVAGGGAAWKGHRVRPSASALLGVEGADDDILDSRDIERQRRLRDYEEDEPQGRVARVLLTAGAPFRGALGFVKKNEGLLLIALSQVFFAAINCCVKLLERDVAMPVWELIFIRMSMTFAGCYSYLRWSGDPNPFLGPPGVRLLLCARGVVGFFGLFPGYYALQYLDLSDATTISFLSPVLVGLLAWVLLREPYSKLEALVGFTSLLGTLFIAKPDFLFPSSSASPSPDAPVEEMSEDGVSAEQRMFAVGVALIGVLGASGAYLIIRLIGKRASPLHSISYFSFYSVIVSCIYPFIFHAPPVFKLEKRFFMLIVPIGVFGFLAQALLTMGLQREKAGRGTLAVYSNLIFAMALERIVFHKLPDAFSLLGASIIIGGAIRVALEKKPVAAAAVTPGSRRASVASVFSNGGGGGVGRRASAGSLRAAARVDAVRAAEEGRKVKLSGAAGEEESRPFRLGGSSDDGLGSDNDSDRDSELFDPAEVENAGGSGIAAARGLGAER